MDFEVFAFIGEPTRVDFETFTAWIDGKSEAEVVTSALPEGDSDAFTTALILQDVRDQFCMFESILLPFLNTPNMAATHLLCPMDSLSRARLLEDYYAFDGPVLREFLGNPLPNLRRSVEDIADATAVSVKSCIRQCENIKRVYAGVEDATSPEAIVVKPVQSTILSLFQLHPETAWKYACILFLFKHRFQIQRSKRLFASVPAEAFICMASAMLFHWVAGAADVAPRSALPEAWMYTVAGMQGVLYPLRAGSWFGAGGSALYEDEGDMSGRAKADTEEVPTVDSVTHDGLRLPPTASSGVMMGEDDHATRPTPSVITAAPLGAFATPFMGPSSGLQLDEVLVATLKALSTCRLLKVKDERVKFAVAMTEALPGLMSETDMKSKPPLQPAVLSSILKGLRSIFTSLAKYEMKELFEMMFDKVLEPLIHAGYRNHVDVVLQCMGSTVYLPHFTKLLLSHSGSNSLITSTADVLGGSAVLTSGRQDSWVSMPLPSVGSVSASANNTPAMSLGLGSPVPVLTLLQASWCRAVHVIRICCQLMEPHVA